jgi:catechol 2,3-dioxygenase-like lactoylglutathione lyase family enzyme
MPISSGPIVQTAWVVHDLDAAERFFTELMGVRSWTRIADVHFGPESCTHRGAPADYVASISLAYLGDMQLELIAPVHGVSLYTEFLDRAGPGLHHVCVVPDDWDAALAAAAQAGVPVLAQGSMGTMQFAYLDGAAYGVPYLEVAQWDAGMDQFFDAIREQNR